ncbi:MAG: hypothetical protein AAGU05_02095, partial [Anaerolineaceae bacterium]
MKRRLVLVILPILIVAFILQGCGGAAASPAATETVSTQPPSAAPADTQPVTEPAVIETAASTETDAIDADALAAGKKLVEERCSVCHSLSRVTSKRASHDQWEQTVDRMIANGAQLNSEEKQLVV